MLIKILDELEKLVELILGPGDENWLTNEIISLITFLSFLYLIGSYLLKLSKQVWSFIQSYKLSKDFHPFYSQGEIKEALSYYIQTTFQNVDPSDGKRPDSNLDFTARNNLIRHFTKITFNSTSENKYFIVLGGSGMGKSTFLINMVIAYRNSLRRFFFNHYSIKLIPLGHPKATEEIESLDKEKQKNTILLLDALDEDAQAIEDYKSRVDYILNITMYYRYVVIAARTQFFKSDEELPNKTGFFKYSGNKGEYKFGKIYISPFDKKDINRYIRKRFSIFSISKKRKARQLVMKVPYLMIRPMLLSYIEDLLDSNKKLKYSFEVYELLIEKWIEREHNSKPSQREDFKSELHRFSSDLAPTIYQMQKKERRFYITNKELQIFKEKHKIKLEELEMRSRSLLNRTAEGGLKYSHKSIYEYFIAKEYFKSNLTNDYDFEGLDFAVEMLREMCNEWLIDNFQDYIRISTGVNLSEVKKIGQITFKEEYLQLPKHIQVKIILGLPLFSQSDLKDSIEAKKYMMDVRDKEYKRIKKMQSGQKSKSVLPVEPLEERKSVISKSYHENKQLINNLIMIKALTEDAINYLSNKKSLN